MENPETFQSIDKENNKANMWFAFINCPCEFNSLDRATLIRQHK